MALSSAAVAAVAAAAVKRSECTVGSHTVATVVAAVLEGAQTHTHSLYNTIFLLLHVGLIFGKPISNYLFIIITSAG